MNTLQKLETCRKIKCLWEQRKLPQVFSLYNRFGLCMLMNVMLGEKTFSRLEFMNDIHEAAKNKPYYSGNSGCPLKALEPFATCYGAYHETKEKGVTFDRRNPYGKMRYQLLCDLITYYEEELKQ